MNKFKVIIMGLILVVTIQSSAKTDAQKAKAKGLSAVTVFVDITSLTRKNSAARKMTKLHQEFADVGYELVNLSPYNENGDLEGFFVSYKLIR